MSYEAPDDRGYFGDFGGCFAPEILMQTLGELNRVYAGLKNDSAFQHEVTTMLRALAGRATPLSYAPELTNYAGGGKIYLKREDLTKTGSHHINSAVGQGILARHLGKTRLTAETGAGEHGVAIATVAAHLDMACTVYMGAKNMRRQAPNVERMEALGATVVEVSSGSGGFREASADATRDLVANVRSTFYAVSSIVGPHPYPMIVRDFQSIIGREVQSQISAFERRQPDHLVACIGGGSNAIGLFYPFLGTTARMTGVEAGGRGIRSGMHAARFATGRLGIFQGTKSMMLRDRNGQLLKTHSIAVGLDVPVVGPEHCYLRQIDRAQYTAVDDGEALSACELTAKLEGIKPALESSHAIASGMRLAGHMDKNQILVICVSGSGVKEV